MEYTSVSFTYLNDFEFRESIQLEQVGKTIKINKEFLNSALQSETVERLHVFSFDRGVLIISDLRGNCFSIVPSSALVEVYGFLSGLSNKDTLVRLYDKLGQSVGEFFRINPDDCDYSFSVEFKNDSIHLTGKKCTGVFDEQEFVKGLVEFTDEVLEIYDSKYPLFRRSPVRAEIIGLQENVREKYLKPQSP